MLTNVTAEKLIFWILRLLSILVFSIAFLILGYIFFQGLPRLKLDFIILSPSDGMMKGGIFPAIIGTFFLILCTSILSFPLALFAGIYLSEYANNRIFRFISQVMTQNLSGVPSIVFGLFGLAFFVRGIGLGVSLLSGSLTLAVMILPMLIKTTEESLKSIDSQFRLTSYALGANKIQTIFQVLLPMAFPNILSALILSIGRISGETAAILFTAVTFFSDKIDFDIKSQVMALPYHIYIMATTGIDLNASREIAFASSMVLISLILVINILIYLIQWKFFKR